LPQAPCDVRLNQRLAALHTRFQRFTEAAVCCRTLESVYHDAGCPDEAVRYGELAARYERSADAAASTSASSTLASSAAAPSASASPAMGSSAPAPPSVPPFLVRFRSPSESAAQPPAEPEPEITEIEADEPAGFEVETESQHKSEIEASPDIVARAESAPAQAVPAEASELTALVADLEASLGDSFPQAPASGDQLAATH